MLWLSETLRNQRISFVYLSAILEIRNCYRIFREEKLDKEEFGNAPGTWIVSLETVTIFLSSSE